MVKTKEMYIAELRELYDAHGLVCMSNKWLRDHKKLNIYNALQIRQVTFEDVSKIWGIHEAFLGQQRTLEYQRREKIKKSSGQTSACQRIQLPYRPSKEYLLEIIQRLFEEHGSLALSKIWLENNGYIIIYERLRSTFQTTIEEAAKSLNLHADWVTQAAIDKAERSRKMITSRGKELWTVDRIYKTAEEIIQKYAMLPPTAYLIDQGYASFVTSIHKFKIKYDDLKVKYNCPDDERRISRDGKSWLSAAEAGACNFLISRGIVVTHGRTYPKEYAKITGKAYGVYDMHFKATVGKYAGDWMDVEIFGGYYAGGEERAIDYEKTKQFKIDFNKNNPRFIQLTVEDCYKDSKLQTILEPFIGTPPVTLKTSYDHMVNTCQLSLLDRTLKNCFVMCEKLGLAELPTSGWFEQTGRYINREIFDWEVKGIHADICKLGGLPKMRELMRLSETNEAQANDSIC